MNKKIIGDDFYAFIASIVSNIMNTVGGLVCMYFVKAFTNRKLLPAGYGI